MNPLANYFWIGDAFGLRRRYGDDQSLFKAFLCVGVRRMNRDTYCLDNHASVTVEAVVSDGVTPLVTTMLGVIVPE